MTDGDPLLDSLLAAVAGQPQDVPLRLHVIGMLLERGRAAEAVEHCAVVLQEQPDNPEAMTSLRRATETLSQNKYPSTSRARDASGFDWQAAEEEVRDLVPPAFVGDSTDTPAPVDDVSISTVRLSDVGGMQNVKQRLEAAFLGPMRNPELAKMYGKNLSGGLLLYGPPGVR